MSAHGARTDFQAALLSHIQRFRRFPEEAQRMRQEGAVSVGFVMVRNGGVLDAWVERTSGVSALDLEAVATVRRAQPLPAIPDAMPDSLEVVLPVTFDLD